MISGERQEIAPLDTYYTLPAPALKDVIMLDRFRIPLIVFTALAMLYGAWLFHVGRQSVETERRTRKPKLVTIDDLVLNPPKKIGNWVTITDGGASLARAAFFSTVDLPSIERQGLGEVAVYAPIFPGKMAYNTETREALREQQPEVYLVIRTEKPEVIAVSKTLHKLRGANEETSNAWLLQNKKALVLRPPFTGMLFPRRDNKRGEPPEGKINGILSNDGWVLQEGAKPPLAESSQVAWGLALLMGLPTVWLFALLFTGKLDPPEDEPTAGEITMATDAPSFTPNTPNGSGRTAPVPSSAMPVEE